MAAKRRGQVHVVHITTVHNPFDVRIFHKQCVSLAEAGYDVTLIQRGDRAEEVDGVRILPIPSFRSRMERMTVGVWRATRGARAIDAEIVHIHDPELIWGAVWLKLRGARVIFDVHENLHFDIAAKQWVPTLLKRPLGWMTQLLERLAARLFDHVSAATDGIAVRFPSTKTSVIRNAPRTELFDQCPGPPMAVRAPNMVYIGGLGGGGDVKGIELMLAALAALPADSRVRLLLGGREPEPGFVDRLKRRPGGDRIDFLGWVDQARIPEVYNQAIGAFVLYPPMPNNVESEPVKLFESMAAGVPVIVSNFPLFCEYMRRWDCGVAAKAEDAAAIAQIIHRWELDRLEAQRLGDNGRRAIREERSWAAMSRELIAIYDRLAGPAIKIA